MIGAIAAEIYEKTTPLQRAVASVQETLVHDYPAWGEVEQTLIAPAPPPTPPIVEPTNGTPIPEPLASFLGPALEGWTVEEMEAWPLTPEGLVHPEAPLSKLIVATGGAEAAELLATTPAAEIAEMPGPGIALPGIGEIKFPDILGGLGDLGKYALMAGALIIGVFMFDRLTRKK